ncbi:MAG: hypothetical protein AMXMBFR57_26890 [Acidimicrobiia bacterium]
MSRGVQQDANSPAPIFPRIYGTGFFIHESGIIATNRHVIEALQDAPRHPVTNEQALSIVLNIPETRNGQQGQRSIAIDIDSCAALTSFVGSGPWFGADLPDIGFVFPKVKDVPFLRMATEDFAIRPGLPVAMAGYPLGEIPMTFLRKLSQTMPTVRSGIVSSIFPFTGTAQPHGFMLDILQQGGSSGSPIFLHNRPDVIGMMSSGLTDFAEIFDKDGSVTGVVRIPTNFSIAEPAFPIQFALQQLLARHEDPRMLSQTPTLAEKMAALPGDGPASWEVFRRPLGG